MTGKIKSDTCNWKVAYKEGKTVLKAVISNENGDDKNVTITIIGKDGKVTLLFEMEGEGDDRIRVTADKFEEAA
jgi:Holliday junction resolvase